MRPPEDSFRGVSGWRGFGFRVVGCRVSGFGGFRGGPSPSNAKALRAPLQSLLANTSTPLRTRDVLGFRVQGSRGSKIKGHELIFTAPYDNSRYAPKDGGDQPVKGFRIRGFGCGVKDLRFRDLKAPRLGTVPNSPTLNPGALAAHIAGFQRSMGTTAHGGKAAVAREFKLGFRA